MKEDESAALAFHHLILCSIHTYSDANWVGWAATGPPNYLKDQLTLFQRGPPGGGQILSTFFLLLALPKCFPLPASQVAGMYYILEAKV